MLKLKKHNVVTAILLSIIILLSAGLGVAVYFAVPHSKNGVFADNRNFKDGYDDFKGFVFGSYEFRADMYFRILLPNGYDENERYPLIIYIHGQGAQGYNNKNQMSENFLDAYLSVKSEHPAIVFVPQFPKGYRGDNGERAGNLDGTYLLMACIKEGVLDRYSVDLNRIYLTGVSMGGLATANLARQFPDFFAALMPVCGGVPTDWSVDYNQVAQKIKDIPIWLGHSKDDNIVPFYCSENLANAITSLGGSVKFTIYEDKGHSISKDFYQQPELWTWLFMQQRIV